MSASLLAQSDGWNSAIVRPGADGRLEYRSDAEGNRIPDFSYAGYRNSEAPIPLVPMVRSLAPAAGDNTARIQAVLDEIARMSIDENGWRGALELAPGIFEIHGTLRIDGSGVVLRGAGDGADSTSNTILRAIGNTPNQRTVILAGSGVADQWRTTVFGSVKNITSPFVPVGARGFRVEDVSAFEVGDNVILTHPCTAEWLEAIDHGGTHSNDPGAEAGVDIPWTVGSEPILYNRYVVAIDGDSITIDAPLFNHFDRSLAQATIGLYERSRLATQIGIENLRLDIETAGGDDENHAWQGIDVTGLEDGWIRDCTILHFGQAAIRTNTAVRVTVENCRALDPVARVTGGRMYNFEAHHASQLILFKDCHASNGRHHYMSNGQSTASGIVFQDCTSEGAYAASEGHSRWSQGLLYDNHTELDGPRRSVNPRLLGLYNRGYFGTSHGWGAVHSVAWNCDVAGGELHLQRPPTGQNYAIGCSGRITGDRPPNSFDHDTGYVEGANVPGLSPRSLFEAQLADRLGTTVDVRGTDWAAGPLAFRLEQNYPNPFNPLTAIRFTVEVPARVVMAIFDSAGRRVATLVDAHKVAGSYEALWNGQSDEGAAVASGAYVVRLTADGEHISRKIVLIR